MLLSFRVCACLGSVKAHPHAISVKIDRTCTTPTCAFVRLWTLVLIARDMLLTVGVLVKTSACMLATNCCGVSEYDFGVVGEWVGVYASDDGHSKARLGCCMCL